MAKLYYRYSAMNSGKSTMAIQVAHNYEEQGGKILVWKSSIDTKGGDTITSRVGINRKVDKLLVPTASPKKVLKEEMKQMGAIDAIIIDEAQFLTEMQVNEIYEISKMEDIPVLCYGLRCDFKMMPFPGSSRLLAIADTIEEIKNICKCKSKATQNLRLVNGIPTFEGGQVAIDGENKVTYESVCGKCYLKYYQEWKEKQKKES